MSRFLLTALLFAFCSASYADDLCSSLTTVKDCAELGCHWSDAEQTCSDKPAVAPAALVACENITSIEICESHSDCLWDWTHCVDKN